MCAELFYYVIDNLTIYFTALKTSSLFKGHVRNKCKLVRRFDLNSPLKSLKYPAITWNILAKVSKI